METFKMLEDVGPVMAQRLLQLKARNPAFRTLAVPAQGFSESDTVHNAVLDYIRRHGGRVFNPGLLAARLERALPRNARH